MCNLTAREKEILSLLLEGKSNEDIAQELRISTGTVKNRLTGIYAELGVASSRQLFPRMGQIREILASEWEQMQDDLRKEKGGA